MKPATKLVMMGIGAVAVFGVALCLSQPGHPDDEQKLIDLLVRAGHEYDHGDTYTKQDVTARTEKAICDTFKGHAIDRWTGVIGDKSEGDGSIKLSIEIHGGMALEAYVGKADASFEAARQLKYGNKVEYSGEFQTDINGCPHSGVALLSDKDQIKLPVIPVTLTAISKM